MMSTLLYSDGKWHFSCSAWTMIKGAPHGSSLNYRLCTEITQENMCQYSKIVSIQHVFEYPSSKTGERITDF